MKPVSSRRNFLAAGLTLPAAASAARTSMPAPEPKPPAPAAPAAPELRYRTIGRTGMKVTSMGFGCMITSDGSVIERAADLGINYFDTARGYQGGNNERMVGAALKGKRNRVYISSKSHASGKQEALADLDKSLSELGTDHLDVWYLHAKSHPRQVTDELIDAQQTAKKAGKIRFAGVSTHGGQPDLMPWLAANAAMDVILTSYNFTMDPGMYKLIEDAKKGGKGIVAMKVMAGGFRRTKPGDKVYNTLKKEGAMVAALKWVLQNPNVDTTIPSMTDMDQLDDNLKAMAGAFTESEKQILAAHLDYIRPLYCRMCGQCDGLCPKGVPVPDVLRFLTYAEGYGQFGLGRERYLELPREVAAVRCGECSSCPIQCPNGVRVTERLIRAQELFA